MSETILVLLILALAGVGYGIGRLHQWIIEVESERPKKRNTRLPNWVIAGLEEHQAIDTETLLKIRDFLTVVEARLNDGMDVIGQIRNGEFTEKSASPKHKNDRT